MHFPDNDFFRDYAFKELIKFDQGTHDDIVDTVAIANMPLTFQVASQPIAEVEERAARGTHEQLEERDEWEDQNRSLVSKGASRHMRLANKHRPARFNSQR